MNAETDKLQICTKCGRIGSVGRCCGLDTHRDATEDEIENMKCPFCGEPRIRESVTGDQFRCGTRGPDGNGKYQTGRTCDTTCFLRLIEKQQTDIIRLRAFVEAVMLQRDRLSLCYNGTLGSVEQRAAEAILGALDAYERGDSE